MPMANTGCIKYYKSGMATLFDSLVQDSSIETLSPAVGFVIRSKHGSTSAEGVHAGGAARGKPREELRVEE